MKLSSKRAVAALVAVVVGAGLSTAARSGREPGQVDTTPAVARVDKRPNIVLITIIIFTSDNGYFLGEHRIPREKTLAYDPSARVPMIVRGPGVPLGVVRRQPVGTIDIAPTVADVANVRPARKVDGRSLLPLTRRASLGEGRSLLFQAWNSSTATVDERFYSAIRTRRWLYSEYATGETELYDLRRDPWLLESEHAVGRHASLRKKLATELADCARAPVMTVAEGSAR